VAAGIAVGLALMLASVSSAYAKPRASQARPPASVITVSHRQSIKLAPTAHAAGHKIA
jgi:hypothetical protein